MKRKFTSSQGNERKMESKTIAKLVGTVVVLIFAVVFVVNMAVTVGAGEIVVKQGAFDGKLDVWTQPGLYCKCFGRLTVYKRSDQYWFSKDPEEGKAKDESIKVRFNDGGHGNISGSLSYDLPTDMESMKRLHATFGSQDNLERRLVSQVVNKAVYMAGPLMSSKESAGESRSDLINYITDQVAHGVFKTERKESKVLDILSGKEKTVTLVTPMVNPQNPSEILREEKPPMEEFGIRAYNLTIKSITYDAQVEEQIKQQQQAIMSVQTQMARAKEAEQKLLTVEKEGAAKAAEARWQQEVEKSKAVTNAEQARDVQKLALETADLRKRELIVLGEGEASRKKAVMMADGALTQKLEAWVDVNKAYAAAMSAQPQVPTIMMGSNGNQDAGNSLLSLLSAKTAKDLGLELKPKADK